MSKVVRPSLGEIRALELKKKQVHQKKKEIIEGLPHLYQWKWYSWAKAFYESRNKICVLTAANQISKSSSLIRKHISRATETKRWPELWRTTPRQFYYLYPNKDTSTAEFETKWVPEFMPRGRFENDPQYGWKAEFAGSPKRIYAIHWNSGPTTYFKHYSQDVQDLQSGTVWALDCDEELPIELFDELMMRLAATDGYANFVFTATRNQDFWRRVMECQGTEEELLKEAFKLQISMYDCLHYDDGTPAAWTEERIEQVKRRCRSQAEVQRRVYGRFVTEEGRKYANFDPSRHYVKPFAIPKDWKYYAAVDIGSGGAKNHPAAISFLAIRPDFRLGYVVRGWRGDGIETTASDILEKFRAVRAGLTMSQQVYDGAAVDFGTIATRAGEGFIRAQKSHNVGEDVVNTLFKNDMLFIFDTDELRKLGTELSTLMRDTAKQKARDDFADSLRYCVCAVPWDWSCLSGELTEQQIEDRSKAPLTEKDLAAREINERRGDFDEKNGGEHGWQDLADEFDFWNNAYGS